MFQKRKKRGELFPAFQFISVTDDCNLSCQGCWVTKGGKTHSLDIGIVNQIVSDSKTQGSFFFGILGGEPLMYPDLYKIFRANPDCYFQLFTNGILLNDQVAEQLRNLGNVTPLISFEGDEAVADTRRGGTNVYSRTLEAVDTAVRNRLITGVAVSVCKSNIDMALSDNFIKLLHAKGVVYLWYYIYRPSGLDPCYDLALSSEEIERLRLFMVEGRGKYPLIIIDSYWDADGNPFCPAAEGLSHHINPSGYIEPCPVLQFARDQVKDGNLKSIYERSVFIHNFRTTITAKTRGCILMEDPAWLKTFALNQQAFNTSNRSDYFNQLANGKIVTSHGSCKVIPEKSWVYRMAKRRAFFGLGGYG